MYSELYAAWQREIDDSTLGALQPDFYLRIGEYMQRIKEEDKVIDKNGYTGVVKHIWKTGQVAVAQKSNVTCTYDHATQLKAI